MELRGCVLSLRLLQAGVIFWIWCHSVQFTYCACTWPLVFQNSVWLDSAKGTLNFTTNNMNGYSALGYASASITAWTCQEETFSTNGIIVARSQSSFSALASNWYAYLCFKFTSVTSVSYIYYLLQGQQPNAGQYRVYVAPESTRTATDACNATAGASGAEFSTVIKQGHESSAYITCPNLLHGRFDFNYTSKNNINSCTTTADHMNVCTDKSQLAFDVPCTQSIVYASGSVFCVASVVVGSDTFVQLYNNQTTVDGSTTYRFSCMAISSDSRSATIVYKNCTNHQTSTYRARLHDQTVIGASIAFAPYVFCKGGCTWPSPLNSSTWRDNTRGDVMFGTDTLTGWTISPHGSTVNHWECLDMSGFTTDGTLLIKATDTFISAGKTWITYLCLTLTKVTDNSYYYYQNNNQDSTGGYERAKFSNDGFLTTKADLCSGTIPPAEFHFMILSGTESESRQFCPPSLLAKMDYTHTTAAGVATCASSTDDWDVCTNRTTMTFNYTTCATQMVFSASGRVYCMFNMSLSGNDYAVVFNTDPSPTYRFACIVSNGAGTAASVVYNNCSVTQTPTSFAKLADGTTSIGAIVTMTAKETCPFLPPTTTTTTTQSTTTTTTTTTSTTTSTTTTTTSSSVISSSTPAAAAATESGGSSSLIPIVAGAAAGGILLLALIAGVTIYFLKCRKRNNVESIKEEEKPKLPDDNPNGHTEKIKIEDLDNPALTVHPEKHTLTPLPLKADFSSRLPAALPPIGGRI